MTSHCANPECATPLMYLREGRIFQFEIRPTAAPAAFAANTLSTANKIRRVSHFWLCGHCSSTLTLAFDALQGVVVRRRAAA